MMIELRDVSFAHDGGRPVLDHVDLSVEDGELLLVAGPTGSGKSTLLGVITGLVPRFSGGTLSGDVLLDGTSVVRTPPRERAATVGYVGQDPAAGFVTDTVEEELAYGMEQLGLPPETMRRRVEETLDLLGIADLRDRALRTLSGGQQQRVAIGSVLTMHPRLLVLDEPTSALDPTAAEDVLATITRLVHDLGVSVVLAEHRLERVVPFADRIALLTGDGSVRAGEPAEILADSPVAPPLVELGRALGWSPLPLTVRDARRMLRVEGSHGRVEGSHGRVEGSQGRVEGSQGRVEGWQGRVEGWQGRVEGSQGRVDRGGDLATPGGDLATPGGDLATPGGDLATPGGDLATPGGDLATPRGDLATPRGDLATPRGGSALTARGITVTHGRTVALRELSLGLAAGRVTALMGRNGAGKSSLLWALQGSGARAAGSVQVEGSDPARLDAVRRRSLVGLLPQHAADLLYLETVDEECTAGGPRTREILDRLVPGIPGDRHPRDLSEGQRLAVALALVLAGDPRVLLLDEPTRGLDYAAKRQLAQILRSLAADGRAVLVATHDVEFTALAADEVVVIAEGEVVSSGDVRKVVAESPAFAPQVTKVLGPPWLRVDEVVGEVVA